MLSKCYTMVMESTGIPDDPLSRFSLSIFRLNGLLMWNGDRITGSIGQSSARWQVLGRVGYQPQTVAQMARDMGHARPKCAAFGGRTSQRRLGRLQG